MSALRLPAWENGALDGHRIFSRMGGATKLGKGPIPLHYARKLEAFRADSVTLLHQVFDDKLIDGFL